MDKLILIIFFKIQIGPKTAGPIFKLLNSKNEFNIILNKYQKNALDNKVARA